MRPRRVLTELQIEEELFAPWKEGKELTKAQMEILFDTAIYWANGYRVIDSKLFVSMSENMMLQTQIESLSRGK
jgi:hypothetical protein